MLQILPSSFSLVLKNSFSVYYLRSSLILWHVRLNNFFSFADDGGRPCDVYFRGGILGAAIIQGVFETGSGFHGVFGYFGWGPGASLQL